MPLIVQGDFKKSDDPTAGLMLAASTSGPGGPAAAAIAAATAGLRSIPWKKIWKKIGEEAWETIKGGIRQEVFDKIKEGIEHFPFPAGIPKEELETKRFEELEKAIALSFKTKTSPEMVRGLSARDFRDLIDSNNLFPSPRNIIARQVGEYLQLGEKLGLLKKETEEFAEKTESSARATKDFSAATEEAKTGTEQLKGTVTGVSEALRPEQYREIAKAVQEAIQSLALKPETLEQFKTLKDYICEAKRCMLELKQAAEEMKVPALPQGAGALEEEGFGDDDFEDSSSDFSTTLGETSFFPTQADKKPGKSPGTISEEIGKVNPAVAQLKNTFEALESGILQTLNGIFQGSQTFAEGMKNLFRNLALSLAQDILKLTVLDPLKKGLGSLLEGLSGGIAGGILSFFGFKAAQGGLLPGQFAPVRAFAGGGVIDRPTFGFVGEGSMPEAVVPMQDRKNIPVKLLGERDKEKPLSVSVQINGDITPRTPNMRPEDVIKVVVNDINNDGLTRRVIIDRVKR